MTVVCKGGADKCSLRETSWHIAGSQKLSSHVPSDMPIETVERIQFQIMPACLGAGSERASKLMTHQTSVSVFSSSLCTFPSSLRSPPPGNRARYSLANCTVTVEREKQSRCRPPVSSPPAILALEASHAEANFCAHAAGVG